MNISIVATLYQSAPYIHMFYERASAAANRWAGESYEIVLVNNGSPDNSLELAEITSAYYHILHPYIILY